MGNPRDDIEKVIREKFREYGVPEDNIIHILREEIQLCSK